MKKTELQEENKLATATPKEMAELEAKKKAFFASQKRDLRSDNEFMELKVQNMRLQVEYYKYEEALMDFEYRSFKRKQDADELAEKEAKKESSIILAGTPGLVDANGSKLK